MSEGVAMPLEMVSRAPIPAGARKVPIPHPSASNQSSTSSAVRKGPIGIPI